jgi:hypothetical protein
MMLAATASLLIDARCAGDGSYAQAPDATATARPKETHFNITLTP